MISASAREERCRSWSETRSGALHASRATAAFFARAGESAALGTKASADAVVEVGLQAFRRNRASVVHGTANYMTTLLSRFTTRELTAKLSARLMKPRPPALGEGSSRPSADRE